MKDAQPTDLTFVTIAEAGQLLRDRAVSPVELTQAKLDRIAATDGVLNSFVKVLAETALEDARRAEAEIMAGAWRGALHGIPLGLKDIYNTAGVETAGQSAVLLGHIPKEDATTVQLLREAGAVIIGKLTTYEFALGGSSFDLPWPPARNPWDTALDPSGSSSGSAAATAAGLCLGAMGSDTGGSIRGPAAWCGLAGLKPTYGLLSRRGILPLSYSLDHAGPMCWTSEDCALMMQALAAHDPQDPASADPGPIDFSQDLSAGVRGLRIGVVRHFFEEDVDTSAETIAALEASLDALRDAGANVVDVRMAPYEVYNTVGMAISRSEAFAIHEHWLKTRPQKYGAFGRLRLMSGAFIPASDYVNAMRLRSRLIAEYLELMRTCDVLIFPTGSGVADPLGADSMALPLKQSSFINRVFNVLGGPALSICSGYSTEGLPLSLQVAGRPFEDALVLRVGHMLEAELGSRERRPPIEPRPNGDRAPIGSGPVAESPPSDGFLSRTHAMGLPRLTDSEMSVLEAMAANLERSAETLRGEHEIAEEPASVFSLQG